MVHKLKKVFFFLTDLGKREGGGGDEEISPSLDTTRQPLFCYSFFCTHKLHRWQEEKGGVRCLSVHHSSKGSVKRDFFLFDTAAHDKGEAK